MGTTLDALNAGYASVGFLAVIEGYSAALFSGDPSSAAASLSGSSLLGHTDITSVFGGLTVDWGDQGQRIDPWKPFGDAPSLRLVVSPYTASGASNDDQFGIDMFKRVAPHESALAAGEVVACNDTTVLTRHTSGFAASGSAYIGPEWLSYGSITGGVTLNVTTRGKGSPFSTSSGGRYARTHKCKDPTTATGDPVGVEIPPLVTDSPTQWVGRWVGVWILRRTGQSTYDTTDQGHLAYAGTIASVSIDEVGRTVIELDSVLSRIAETVIHRDQFRARLVEGCNLTVGQSFGASTEKVTAAPLITYLEANALQVVAGAPASSAEIQAGRYSVFEIAEAIGDWLRDEQLAGRLGFHCQYTAAFTDAGGGVRGRWEYQDPTAGSATRRALLTWPSEDVSEFMGWNADATISVTGGQDAATASPSSPRRWERRWTADRSAIAITVTNPRGTWFSQNASLPVAIKGTSSTIDGVVKIDGMGYMAARRISDTSFEVSRIEGGYFERYQPPKYLAIDNDVTLDMTQVVVLESTFKKVLLWILLSTGTSGYNSATWDVLSEPMGCGIPYTLLGSSFETDLDRLENSDKAQLLIIQKPVRFSDLWQADFALRWCHLIWGAGRVNIRAFTQPLANYATVAIGESTKGAPVDSADRQRASVVEDVSAVHNVIKFNYGADGNGDLRDEITIADLASARDYGARAITLAARNVGQRGASAESIVDLISSFSATMAMFSRPFWRIRRPISLPYFEQLLPLTVIAYTDPHVRNPNTGTRGITSWPAIVLGNSIDWGGTVGGVDGPPTVTPPSGEVDLMLFPRVIAAPYSPACRIDDTATGGGFSSGYNAATSAFKVYSNAYTVSPTSDLATFAAGDVIRIVEMDPSNAGSPTTWIRTINTVTPPNDFTITAALAAPAWDSTKKYTVISDTYSAAVSAQKSNTYQADDADGLVENSRNPYGLTVHGSSQYASFTNGDPTTLPCRPASIAYGDGKPLDTAYDHQIAWLINNMISYKTAPQCPEVYADTASHSGSTDYYLVQLLPLGFGEGRFTSALTRKFYCAPRMRSTDGNTATVRVSVCKLWPQGSSQNGSILIDPYVSMTFTTTSTTFTIPAEQSVDIRHCIQSPVAFGGIAFVAVECKKGATSNVEYEGLVRQYLGPMVAT